jgi:hypothetical protein
VNTVDKQDGFIIACIPFELFISGHERLLSFSAELMRDANRLSITEAMFMQPLLFAVLPFKTYIEIVCIFIFIPYPKEVL